MTRFYAPPECFSKNTVNIPADEARHIAQVLRHKAGDEITVFDGKGREYYCQIEKISAKNIIARILDVKVVAPNLFNFCLVQALPKGNKMDYIVEKCTELGVNKIVPIISARTIAKTHAGSLAKLKRWQNIAVASAKQCGRTQLPQITAISDFNQALSQVAQYQLALIAAIKPAGLPAKEIITRNNVINSLIVFIGPEGDFSDEETARALQAGCVLLDLGKLVLRCDTAAIVTTGIFSAFYGGN